MQLRELIAVNAPFLSQLLDYLLNKCQEISEKRKCPNEWDEFVMALASSSPVCALIHPGDELQQVLTTIADGTADLDIYTLQFLQQHCPLMLNVLQKVKTPPKQLSSVLYELLEKANAPFKIPENIHCEPSSSPCDDDNSYFPALPKIRCRGSYVADTVKRVKICTKRGSMHPTLLPGIFTLFCNHGTYFIICALTGSFFWFCQK